MNINVATFIGKQQPLFKLTNPKVGFQVAAGGKAFLNTRCSNIPTIADFTVITDLTRQTDTIVVDLGERKRL